MSKIQNVMATSIKINTVAASQSVKGLNQVIRATTNAWKAQETQLKSAGNNLGAAKAKYDGLGQAITSLKDKINLLETRQKSLDTSTSDGIRQYNRYGTQIADAEKRLSSMVAQQDRAKQSLNYYKSGLGQLQNSYHSITAVSKSYVERLQAEGKSSEAAKAQLKGLREQHNKLSEIYKIQNDELSRLATSAGKSSEAYKRQQVRVNETATSLAKTRTQMHGLTEAMNKANPSIFDRIKSKLSGVAGEATKTHKTLKDVFMGSFIGNVASNALGNITSGLKSTIASGMQLDATVAKIRAQWAGLGKSKNDTQILVDQMSYLKSNTAMTGGEVQQLQLNMNRLTAGNTEKTVALSKSIATIGDSTKMTSQQMVGLSSAMARALSGSKVSAMQWNRMTKQAPGLGAALSKAAGMSEEAFNKMVSSGKMSSKKFEEIVEKAGQDGGKAFEAFRKTQGGAAKSMADSWAGLKAKMAQPLFDAKTSGMQQLASLMQSGPVQKGAEMLGKAIQKLATLAMKGLSYIAKHKKDIVDIGTDFVTLAKEIAVDTWKDFASIISDIGSAFGLTSKKAKDTKDPLKMLRDAIHGLAKNKEAVQLIAKAIVAIAAVKTLKPVAGSLFSIANGGYKAYKGVRALRAGFKGLDSIKELKGPEAALAKLGSKASTVFGKIKSLAHNALSGKSMGGAFQSLKSAGGFKGLSTAGKISTGIAGAGVVLDSGSQFVNAYKDRHNADKRSTDIGKGIGSAIGGGIGMYFGGPAGAAIGSQIGKAAGAWGGQAVNKFTKGWQSHKPPKKFWSLENLGWSTKDAFSKMGKGIDSWWKSVQKSNKKAQKEQAKEAKKEQAEVKKRQKAWNNYWKKVGKGWNNYWKKVGKGWNDYWKKTSKNASKGISKLKKNTNNYIKKSKKDWTKHWKNNVKTVQKWGKDTKKNFGKGIKYLNKSFKSYTRGAKKSWSKHWKNLKKNVSDFWNSAKKKTSKGSKKLLEKSKDYTKRSKKNWSNHFDHVRKGFDKFSQQLQDNHGDLFKTLKQSASDNLSKLKKTWSDKWDGIKKKISSTWDKIKSSSSNSVTKLRSAIHGGLTKIQSTWGSIWNTISRKTSSIWDGIKRTVNSGVSGVKGMINGMIDGLDNVWKFFTGHKTSIRHLATGGVISSEHLAVVNDEPTNNYQELIYRHNTGKYQMYEGRNRLVPVEPGDEIINGATTAGLKRIGAIPHYAGGGIVGSFVNNAKNVARDVGDIAKNSLDFLVDKMDKIEDWLKDPIGNIKKTIAKWTSGLSAGPVFTAIGRGAINKLIDPIAEWFKARLKKLDDEIGEMGNPGGAGVARWRPFVIKALKMNGFSATGSQVTAWMRVIARESGGNPKAINLWDSNAKAGHPSMGLVQTIGPTFQSYKFPGHNNPFNGFDDLLAGINYMKHIYGSGPGAFATVSGPHGYANGGIARMSQFASLAEDNIPETIIPWDVTKRGRAYQLMDQTLRAFGATDKPKHSQEMSDQTGRAILKILEEILLSISGLNDQDIINNIDVSLGSEVLQKLTQKVKRSFRDDQIKGRLNISGIR